MAKRYKRDGTIKPNGSTVVTNPGDNARYIEHTLRLATLQVVDMNDPNQVRDRIVDYLSICAEEDIKPSVPGLALAFDLSRTQLNRLLYGDLRSQCRNKDCISLIQKAYNMLDLQMNNYMTDGKVNPVAGIFLMKNHFNYADKQEVSVSNDLQLGTETTAKQLEDKYLQSMGQIIDTDVKDVTEKFSQKDKN